MKNREEYTQFLHQKIDEWNEEIGKLKAKADQVEAESRIELQQQIKTLQAKRDEMEDKITQISRSGESAWEDLRSGIDLAWDAMNEAVKSATSRFK